MAVPTAEEQAREQQAGLLKAIAEQGSRGATFYAQQADQAQAQKQAAVSAALDRADTQGGPGSTGAPAALRTQLGAQAASVGDARVNDVAAATTNYSQDQAALTAANDAYMNQLHDAIPLVRTRADEAAAEQQRQLAMQKQLADLELQRSQISLQQSQLGLQGQRDANAAAVAAANRAASGSSSTPSVAQQKYDDQQAQQNQQNAVIQMASGANQATQNAFAHIMSTGGAGGGPVKSLPEALNALQEGLAGDPVSTGFGVTVPNAPIYHDFGADVNPDQLAAFINAFFASPDSGGGSAGTSAIPGIGGVARRV